MTPTQKKTIKNKITYYLWKQENVITPLWGASGFNFGLFPNKRTMTFYVLSVNSVCIIFPYEQTFLN